MSQNNLPQSLPCIEKLISRIKSAEKTNNKDVKITLQEGKDIIYELALLTSKMPAVLNEINNHIKEIKNIDQKIDVKFDGGNF
jgi:hypothetical protein